MRTWAGAKGRSLPAPSAGKPKRKSRPGLCPVPVPHLSLSPFPPFPGPARLCLPGCLPSLPWRAGLGCTHVCWNYMLPASRGAGESGTQLAAQAEKQHHDRQESLHCRLWQLVSSSVKECVGGQGGSLKSSEVREGGLVSRKCSGSRCCLLRTLPEQRAGGPRSISERELAEVWALGWATGGGLLQGPQWQEETLRMDLQSAVVSSKSQVALGLFSLFFAGTVFFFFFPPVIST